VADTCMLTFAPMLTDLPCGGEVMTGASSTPEHRRAPHKQKIITHTLPREITGANPSMGVFMHPL